MKTTYTETLLYRKQIGMLGRYALMGRLSVYYFNKMTSIHSKALLNFIVYVAFVCGSDHECKKSKTAVILLWQTVGFTDIPKGN